MKKKIKNKVKSLKEKHGTTNPFELCNYLNISILYNDLGNIKGIYQNADKVPIIHLNSNLSYHDQLYTCAHELGHAIFHSSLNTVFLEKKTFFLKNKYENEANFFAVELLLNNIALDFSLDSTITLERISQISGIPLNYLELFFN